MADLEKQKASATAAAYEYYTDHEADYSSDTAETTAGSDLSHAAVVPGHANLERIWAWNASVPARITKPVHAIFKETVSRQPTASAIDAWDGEFTYEQLDALTDRLAKHLVLLGVTQETVVPLCFEKSKWTPVATLAVMKAGGACVGMDVSQPEERLRSIVSQLNAQLILSSETQAELAGKLGTATTQTISLDEETLDTLFADPLPHVELPEVNPNSLLYLVFTSGSTGTPKGVMVTHSNFSSAIEHQQAAHHFHPQSRVYDFASYAFDVSWSNVLHTLTVGGVLCIPSEDERKNDLAASLERYHATYLDITPSLARLLPDSAFKRLETVTLGGEALPAQHAQVWASMVENLNNPYGPSECTPTATITRISPDELFKGSIGKGLGLNTWVVDPISGDSLMPIGHTGELWLEGPLVGAGYFGDKEKTQKAFIEDPEWLTQGCEPNHAGRTGRLFRTGDLVRYNADGSLTFVGRKDAQVKINGQRVELGEIEHQISLALPQNVVADVVAEMVERGTGKKMLVAFLEFKHFASDDDDEFLEFARKTTNGLSEKLRDRLPAYMVPSSHVPLREFPMTGTGKTDRRTLRQMAEAMSLQDLSRLTSSEDAEVREPTTEVEVLLHALWAAVLAIDADSFGVDANFLHLGGDSIVAMKLVAAARDFGIATTVADVFGYPVLADLAKVVRLVGDARDECPPFSLLQRTDAEEVKMEVAQMLGVSPGIIEDVFPCTPLQQGMLSMTLSAQAGDEDVSSDGGNYVVSYPLQLHDNIDLGRLTVAWDKVMSNNAILRTRIVDLQGQGLVQVVVDEVSELTMTTGSIESITKDIKMGLGSPLAHFKLVKNSPDEPVTFLWTMHHAAYDGWSVRLLVDQVYQAYMGLPLGTIAPFQNFIQHIQSIDNSEANEFWQKEFRDLDAPAFPRLPSATYTPKQDALYESSIDSIAWPKNGITASTIFRSALALLLSEYTASDDVLFGVTMSGRQAAVSGVDQMSGPTITTIPVRVSLEEKRNKSLQTLLSAVQQQAISATDYEQLGLQNIKKLGTEATRATQFQTLLVVQPKEEDETLEESIFNGAGETMDLTDKESFAELSSSALVIECHFTSQDVKMQLSFDSSVISKVQIERFASQLSHIIQQLCQDQVKDRLLADIETKSALDLDLIWGWNATVPKTDNVCVHDIFSQTAALHADKIAIDAWDGKLTYKELDSLSTALARQLLGRGVAGTVVPLCFKKSKWTPVAVWAVIKAGGASVTLDTSQPVDRLKTIVAQVEPVIVLSSETTRDLASSLTSVPVRTIDDGSITTTDQDQDVALPAVDPSSRLYIVFTSGSTGTPKGVTITHANFASAIFHQQSAHKFKPTSRVYDFASYAFDVSWSNMLHTSTIGACLCIPSDEDRKNDLAGSIVSFQSTHADLTPSAAAILPESVMKGLDTIVLGGEKVPEAAIEWSRVVDVINPYGPSECTPTATLTQIQPDQLFTGSIGKGLGLNTWIVSTVKDALVPVGAVGELWLEGPLVGNGYVGDAEKTAAAFVQDPTWLSQGPNGRHGKLYRTGDLVRYGDDGELIFLGRKDAQVKINGQRVELSEIESHIQRHALIRQVACIIPKEGPCAGRLTAVVSFHDTSSSQAFAILDHSEAITQRVDEVEAAVEATLPAYMIPSVWIPATNLPLSVSGKLNHRELLQRVASVDKTVVSRGETDPDAPAREASNEMEAMLRRVCSAVLNVPEDQINLDQSFIANGGDSISAMRLASQCRAASGVAVSVGPLLKSKSLAALAATLKAADEKKQDEDQVVVDVPFKLSPIQQWYFEQVKDVKEEHKKDAYCNQGCYLKLNKSIAVDKLADALYAVAEAHPMLRAKFTNTEQGWTQTIPKFDKNSVKIQMQSLSSLEEVSSLATKRHQSLYAEAGDVFTADICTLPNETYLVMVAHHLVIDLVSWRIISDDIEACLQGATLQSSLSFQSWTKAQATYASTLNASKALSTANAGSNLAYWNFTSDIPNAVVDQQKTHVVANAETTALVLGSANTPLNTEPVDLLISAVWHAFFEIFSDRENLTIFSEGHGRETWSDDIDLAKTVGWFTTISPIAIASASSVVHLIRQVKDARRFLPSNGFSYFSSRYLSEEGKAAFAQDTSSAAMEMVFNYHGQFQQFEQADAVFLPADLGIAEVGPQLPASSLFGIEVSIEGGLTKFEVSANKHIAHQERIARWAQQIPESLASICAALTRDTVPKRTLHDHAFLGLTYETLDTLENDVLRAIERTNNASVQAVLPPNPTVDGILLSQLKEPESYKTVQLYEVSGHDLNISKLAQAWTDVVAKQPALRTVFTPSLDTNTAFYQVTLDAHTPAVQQLTASSAEDAIQKIKALPVVSYANVPPHRVAICQISPTAAIICIEMSHAITDGASNGIIAQSWIDAYSGAGLGSVNLLDTMTGFAAHLQANPADQKLKYWTSKLAEAKPSYFPELNSTAAKTYSVVEGKVEGTALTRIQNACSRLSITPASVVQSAWALTLASYLGADSATFGYLASGRDLDIPGLDECIGAYTNMLVCHSEIDYTKPGSQLASTMYDQILEDLKHQHASLAAVQHALGFSGSSKGLFNTIMSFQKQEAEISSAKLAFKTLDGDDPTEYDVVVNVGYSNESIELLIDYSTLCMNKKQAERMVSLFCSFMTSMLSEQPLSAQQAASDADLKLINKWNETPITKISVPVHQLIQKRVALQPEALAIDAWDGKWTYAELDAISTKLAQHLVSVGATNTIVPAVFDKSKWTPVAMLAVMKAGAATVLVDPNQPTERLRAIVQQADPVVILSSAANVGVASGLGVSNVMSVDEDTMNNLEISDTSLPSVNASSPIYLVFTSGSTGVPKGVVVTHSNIASAIEHQRSTLALDSSSRIYDYSSYMFDVVWCNLLQGLTAGSCICIPADEDRKTNLVNSITSFSADTVIMTPSAVRGLDIKSLTTLKNLHFIGEALRAETFQDLPASVTVTNLYGPTECTTYSTAQKVASDASGSISIGLGSGTTAWIVHPGHGQTLLPVGAIGELCIEGPLVAAGYLGDVEKTKAVFEENPHWLPREGRVYKTGDLVSYDAEGKLTFVGRKDAQVKIHGQRVELGEIEHHVQQTLSDDGHTFQVIADVITPEGGSPMLAAFVSLDDTSMNEKELQALVAAKSAKVDGLLASRLPPHMIPSAYIAVAEIPKTPSGKTDRKVLRALGKTLSLESLAMSADRRQPSTPAEHALQGLWADVLSLQKENISVDNSFLRIGGDSVSAMKLVGKAREAGMTLTVADIFSNPRLEDMAAKMQAPEGEVEEVIESFGLLPVSASKEDAVAAATAQCGVDAGKIQDVYPCTPLQEGMMALTLKRPGDYVLRCVFELKAGIDVAALKRSWDELVKITPTLRTRVVDLQGKLAQAVLDESAHWQQDGIISDVSQIHKPEQPVVMELGTPLLYAQMVTNTANNTQYLVITIHHALYDGWSLGLVFDELEKIHLGSELSSSSSADFRQLVRHATGIEKDEAKSFWANHFAGSESAPFPALPSPMYEPVPRSISTHAVTNISWPSHGITPSTLVRAAISILVSKYTDTRDVTFGITSSGRQAPIPGIERMVGPAIATVPFRVSFEADDSLEAFLSKMQTSAVEMTKYEQTGLQHIRKMSADCDNACQFQMLVIVQPADEASEWSSNIIERDVVPDEPQELDTYAMTLECQLNPNGVKIKTTFDENVMSEMHVRRFEGQLEHTLRQLCAANKITTVGEVSATSESDLRNIWTWNKTVPEAVDAAVHDLIHQRALLQPDAPAICAWNGEFNYKQLDDLSTQLAFRLIDAGITSKNTIPLFFEKSKWTPIAMVAVMKAGASAVAVDCGQPDDRLLSIISQVEAPLILCSQDKQAIAQRLVSLDTIVVDDSAFPVQTATVGRSLPAVSPSSKLYIVFTSGSTGTPKGVVITHRNMASAIHHQKVIQCMHSKSRVFDFASYAFDVAWANTMCSFEVGACLCIPSDADRKDDLSGAVLRLKATHADVTPSAALVLSDEALQQLDTLTLGGERLTMDNASKWAEHVIVKNSYGPSECTPTATFSEAIRNGDDFNGTIGTGSGLNTWIVDAETGSCLVPVGAVGELWLEGPLVGDGYLNDPVKTDGVFIKNPKWLQAGLPASASTSDSVPGRYGRLYKTGDLVRYNPDGSIDFIGRKDAQVKINGQRVELTEIETHITSNASVFQAACFWVTSGPCARRLVCVLSLAHLRKGDIIGTSIALPLPEEAALFDSSIEDITAKLKVAVPSYMVPGIWIPLFDLPQTASGKMNGKALKDWLVRMDDATFQRIKSDAQVGAARAAETETEAILCQACSSILNVPEDQVNLEASFIANGGDSITAMQVASACRAKGVTVSVALLLRAKTLAEFAASSGAQAKEVVSYKEEYDTLFELSPIQQWYFGLDLEMGKDGQQYNQGFYLKLKDAAAPNKVQKALDAIVASHSMLRARFQLVDGAWMQKILPPATDNDSQQYHFEQSQLPDLASVESLASSRQASIDIVNGPVFSADLCILPSGEQYLILIAHHAVVDLVSWRVIMDDLETLLTNTSSDNSLISSMPFQLWAKSQQGKATQSALSVTPDKLLSTPGASADLSFWQFAPGLTPNTRGDHTTLSVRADASTTRLLLSDANAALNTEPVELLLSAVWHAFLASFPERQGLTVFNEGHGREPWNESDDIDIAKTVGWFTTMAPIHIARQATASSDASTTVMQLVRQVKDARRRMPGNGLPYFASRYLTSAGKEAFAGHDIMEVLFNYHGQFHQLERDDAFFQDVTFDSVVEQGANMPESSLFNLEVSIDDSQVDFSVSYNRHIAHQGRIQAWIAQIASSLETICDDLAASTKTKTLADYSFLHLDYAGLDKLHQTTLPAIASDNNNSSVDDIFPCKPTVDGILLSQIKDPEAYKTVQIYEVKHAQNIDIARLSQAWGQVVAKQPALRTVFVPGLDEQAAFCQVILSSHSPEIITISADDEESARQKMESLPPTDYQQLTPPHRIVLCQISPSTVLCQIEMSHAITDGFSSSVVVEEWMAAYNNTLKAADLLETTRQFNRLSSAKPVSERLSFWSHKLAGIEPCVFPRLNEAATHKDICNEVLNITGSQLDMFISRCAALSVTPSSVVMAAWALTLSAYTGLDSVAFGYLASGRDLPVSGLDECVGAFANMMILKADNLRRQESKTDYVQGVHGQVMKDLSYQHCSLASIQHELVLGANQVLFNSIISFQRAAEGEEEEDGRSLQFKNIDGLDPTEVRFSH